MKTKIVRWFNRVFRKQLYVGFDDKRIQEILDTDEMYTVCYNENTGKVYYFG